MPILAIKTKDVAELLNSNIKDVEQKFKGKIFKLGKEKMVSIFTLAEMLNTTPQKLLDLLEDYYMGELIAEVEEDEILTYEEAVKRYKGTGF